MIKKDGGSESERDRKGACNTGRGSYRKRDGEVGVREREGGESEKWNGRKGER